MEHPLNSPQEKKLPQSKYIKDGITGEDVLRESCIKIGARYYEIGKSAVIPEGRKDYVRIDNPELFFDWRTKNYKVKGAFGTKTQKGVVDCGTASDLDGLVFGNYTLEINPEWNEDVRMRLDTSKYLTHTACIYDSHAEHFVSTDVMCKFFGVKSIDDLVLPSHSSTYYSKSSERIFKCEVTGQWEFIDYRVKYIKTIEKGKIKTYGYCGRDASENLIYLNSGYICLTAEDANELGYYEDIYDGKFKAKSEIVGKKGKGKSFPLPIKYRNKTIESKTFEETEGNEFLYGAEFETSIGFVPSHLEYPMHAEKDGSLRDERGDVISKRKNL